MNLRKLLAFSIAAAAMMIFAQSSANAQINAPFLFPGYGYYGGCTNGGYTSYDLPYFSVHPPVYYSDRIVRRPYGVSPFAVPPGVRPIEYEIPAEKKTVILNPHYKGKNVKATEAAPKVEAKKAGAAKGKQASLIVPNPYYQARIEPSESAHVLK